MDSNVKRRRGRPRPDETIARDNTIEKLLREQGSMTRNDIAEKLGLDTTITYLSLDRLRRQARVKKCAGTGSSTLWLWTGGDQTPCP